MATLFSSEYWKVLECLETIPYAAAPHSYTNYLINSKRRSLIDGTTSFSSVMLHLTIDQLAKQTLKMICRANIAMYAHHKVLSCQRNINSQLQGGS